MVLSNKKLKEKLRAELAKSLSQSATGTEPCNSNPSKTDLNLQSLSLKERLGSVTNKPRISKREKRRKILPFKGLENSKPEEKEKNNDVEEKEKSNGNADISEDTNEKKKKKRKRNDDEMEKDDKEEDDGAVKSVKKLKKKKKKKRKAKKSKPENVEAKVEIAEPEVEVANLNTDSPVDEVVPTKVYVGGIPYYYSEDDIRDYFKGCGTIIEVGCKMRPEDGKFTGIAFITFETEDASKRALALDYAAMGERFLTIQPYKKNPPPPKSITSGFKPELVEGYNRIYVGNMSYDTTDTDLRKLFTDCVITSLRLGKNKETGESLGYAHVDFKDSVSTAMALKLDQTIVRGRPVKISCALPKKEANTESASVPEITEIQNVDNMVPAVNEVHNAYNSRNNYEVYNEVYNELDNGNLKPISTGKIRRRTCYECGEKGHLSSECPSKRPADALKSDQAMIPNKEANTKSAFVPEINAVRNNIPSVPEVRHEYNNGYNYELYKAVDDGNSKPVNAGKIRRRTCYECGEKGHLSSECPNKKPADALKSDQAMIPNKEANTPSVLEITEVRNNIAAVPEVRNVYNNGNNYELYNEVDNGDSKPVNAGKIRRRTCYECGEKGHLSSACPNKKTATDA